MVLAVLGFWLSFALVAVFINLLHRITMNSEFFSNLNESLSVFFTGWDPAIASGVCAAVVLVAVWMFVRVIRTLAVVLFTLCIVFLVLKVGFDIDLSSYLPDFKEKVQEAAPLEAADFPAAY